MAVLKKYDIAGKEIGEVSIDDAWLEDKANGQMIKDYLVALRANQRQWSASTKTRAEVAHSGQKPHPQKGTGRARQGYLGAPQYKGGGRVFTPRPKFDQHVHINRKEKKAAIRSLLVEKIRNGTVHVLQYSKMQEPKTKKVVHFLESRNLIDKRVLFLGEGVVEASKQEGSPMDRYEIFIKSMRNIPKLAFLLFPNVNGYDIAVNHDLVVMESAVDELMMMLGGSNA